MTLADDFLMTIGGECRAGAAAFEVINPATEEVCGEAPDCARAQLDKAVAAARFAFPAWAATPIEERRQRIRKLGRLLVDQADALKHLLTVEQGKPHRDAHLELSGAGRRLLDIADLEPPLLSGDDGTGRAFRTRYVPLGVVGLIVPWNFPVALAMFKLGPALLAGNCAVLKPSPFTPLTTLKLGMLARDIFPPGVLNVISGGDALGPWMSEHPGIDKISFTGSTETGKRVMAGAASSLKRLTLELGGNDAAIVLPDVDVRAAAPQLFWSAFMNNGQLCVAAKRLYVHDDIYPALAAEMVAYARGIKMGDGSQQGTQLGPINNRTQYERVRGLVADIADHGYDILNEPLDVPSRGYFVPVTLVDNPPDDARIVREEQFGPVLPLLRYRDIDDAVERANESDFGLGGSVWSGDEKRAFDVAERLETGTVFVNGVPRLSAFVPFSGSKQSGFGVEGGVPGLIEYMSCRTVYSSAG